MVKNSLPVLSKDLSKEVKLLQNNSALTLKGRCLIFLTFCKRSCQVMITTFVFDFIPHEKTPNRPLQVIQVMFIIV